MSRATWSPRAIGIALVIAGCAASPASLSDGGSIADGAISTVPERDTIGRPERRAMFVIPPAHDGTTPLPLVVLLHGDSSSAAIHGRSHVPALGSEWMPRVVGWLLRHRR